MLIFSVGRPLAGAAGAARALAAGCWLLWSVGITASRPGPDIASIMHRLQEHAIDNIVFFSFFNN